MNGPKLSFDLKNRNSSSSSSSSSTSTNNNEKVIYRCFSSVLPSYNIIYKTNSVINNSNTIKVYKCLKTNTYAVIKIENNRMYRLIGPKLIAIIIHNIDTNWQFIYSYENMSNFDIRRLYLEYGIK